MPFHSFGVFQLIPCHKLLQLIAFSLRIFLLNIEKETNTASKKVNGRIRNIPEELVKIVPIVNDGLSLFKSRRYQ